MRLRYVVVIDLPRVRCRARKSLAMIPGVVHVKCYLTHITELTGKNITLLIITRYFHRIMPRQQDQTTGKTSVHLTRAGV